ncbi:MAG TPA: hypothetical protein VEO95_01925 [Chthoniobacteraceae bacterium]|nr:hypothetical protein [Chthoniobacteraceae bacterium]
MILNLRTLAGSLALVCLCASAAGQGASLTKDEIADAIRTDDFSIPMPAELMAALEKQGKLDWSAMFRPPIPTNYPNRAQLALNLGSLVADGFIAVQAEDSRQVINLGKDIIQLAKNLGVPKDILTRSSSISDFAERKQWDQLKEELEATQNEVKEAMHGSKDSDLVTLVSVGGWARGMDVISNYISAHYSETSAKILRQPGIVQYLNRKLDSLPDKLHDDPKVKNVRMKTMQMEMIVSFPRDKAPELADVKKLSELATELVKEISQKEK